MEGEICTERKEIWHMMGQGKEGSRTSRALKIVGIWVLFQVTMETKGGEVAYKCFVCLKMLLTSAWTETRME